jgi:hypothetical protein
MLCWANQTWTGVRHGLDKRVLIEQTYPGEDDDRAHFACVLRAFRDPRYLRVQGKPVFVVYRPAEMPDPSAWAARWRCRAEQAGLDGLYLIAVAGSPFWDASDHGFDAFVHMGAFMRRRPWTPWSRPVEKLRNKWADWRRHPSIFHYSDLISHFDPDEAADHAIPCVVPNWDNTPCSGARGVVLAGSTPAAFGEMLDKALQRCRQRNAADHLLFVKSWNEWAEGNHLEPGVAQGHAHLCELKRRLQTDAV